MTTYWRNPWLHAVTVRIEHLAAVLCEGEATSRRDNASGNPEYLLAKWREYGEALDAYVLPGTGANVGVRFGADDKDYLSPYVAPDREAGVRALLERASTPGYALRRHGTYRDLPEGSDERRKATEAHLESIRGDASAASDPDDDPYRSSGDPLESASWREGVSLSASSGPASGISRHAGAAPRTDDGRPRMGRAERTYAAS